ncbi:hypothetical protein C8F04DRAFT_1108613 [Mycena alexandri]|uniref:Uncharacterized protein n=1 Tax=Mycena alexandri TaxID=1745969 RepID=A0AAD6SQ76_9AGAR|nr:hypothetical protein C8F04DRAFT_1108613 [Mycena alexandri]
MIGPSIFIFFAFFLYPFIIHVDASPVSRPIRSAIVRRDTSPLTAASWIWTANSTSAGNVAFLKNITAPSGKTASHALVSMTAVANWTLWINGQPIGGSGSNEDQWTSAHVLRATLNASVNTFSILVNGSQSTTPPPGLLVAIQVSFSDSTNSTFLSDSSWLAASTNIPSDFPLPSNLSPFAPATAAAPYGSGPWGQGVSLPAPDPNPVSLKSSSWIWSTANASLAASAGTVGFRKTFATPVGKRAQSVTILLSADNNFKLYLNGQYVGAPPGSGFWQYAQQFTVDVNATLNAFTVIAQNFPSTREAPQSPAGFIAAIRVLYADNTSDIIATDSSWLSGGFISLDNFFSTDDARLSPSFVLGPMGMEPWRQLSGISDALSAASVPSAPFTPEAPASSGSNNRLASRSVLVGIILTVVVAVLVVVLLAILFMRRRRRNSQAKKNNDLEVVTPTPFWGWGFSVVRADALQRSPFAGKAGRDKVTRTLEDSEAPPPSYAAADSEQPSPSQSVSIPTGSGGNSGGEKSDPRKF